MAKVKYGEALGDFQVIPMFFNMDTLDLGRHTRRLAIFTDTENGYSVEFHGTKLQTKHGFLSGGTVGHIEFLDPQGNSMLDIDGRFSVKSLAKAADKDGFSGLLAKALGDDDKLLGSTHSDYMIAGAGNDNLQGGAGDDWLIGEHGNDRLNGGLGNDQFFCGSGSDKDVIVDFDPSTWNPDDPEHSEDLHGQGHQDLIRASGTYTLVQSGADTIVNFGDGDSVRLLNVDKALIDDSDFLLF